MHALVKDIMTADVVAVRSDAPYREMTALLRSRRVSGLPVVDTEGIVIGVVSETDPSGRDHEPGRTRRQRGPPDVRAQAAAAPGRGRPQSPGRDRLPVRRAERVQQVR